MIGTWPPVTGLGIDRLKLGRVRDDRVRAMADTRLSGTAVSELVAGEGAEQTLKALRLRNRIAQRRAVHVQPVPSPFPNGLDGAEHRRGHATNKSVMLHGVRRQIWSSSGLCHSDGRMLGGFNELAVEGEHGFAPDGSAEMQGIGEVHALLREIERLGEQDGVFY